MTTDRVRRAQAATGERPRKHKVGPPAVWLAVIALSSALAPADVPTPFGAWNVGVAGQVLPTVSIGDATVAEGNSGVTTLSFPVTLSAPSTQEVRVGYGTVGGVESGTATGGLTQVVRQSAAVLTTIPDSGPASTYPITINVSGVTGPLEQIDVALNGLTHTSPSDIDMLLEAPSGEKMVILSDAGGSTPAAKVVMTLKDDAASGMPAALISGVFVPFSGPPPDSFPTPAPAGQFFEVGPGGPAALNDLFRDIDPNGLWKIWIVDDTAGNQGSIGNIALTLGTADPNADFVSRFGQLVFPPGTTSKTIDVKVNGDLNVEANETILQDLFSPVGSLLGRARATGTIVNDDGGSGGLPPTTVNDAYQTFRDAPLQVGAPGVLANDMTNLGGPLSAQLIAPPSLGSVTLASDGSFTYVPRPGVSGIDSFTYRARNAAGDGNIAVVTISVTASPPTAVNDRYFGRSDNGRIGRDAADGVLSNDDTNGGGPMTAVLVEGPKRGKLLLNPDGSFTYSFERLSILSDSFTYRAVNAAGMSEIATVDLIGFEVRNFYVRHVDRSNGRNLVTARFDPPAQGPAPTQYELQGGILPGQTLATLLTGNPYPIVTFDAPTGSFKIRFLPLVGTGRGATSNEIDLHTTTTVTPSAPENLLIAVNGSRLDLAWRNTFRGGIPDVILDVTGDATVSLPLGPVETFSFTGVPSLNLNFSVRAVNAGGSSPNSNQVSGSFPGTCTPPLTPENFLVYVNGLVLGAIWDLPPAGTAPTGYTLDVASAVYTGTVKVPRLTNVRANVTSGTYSLRVKADHDECGSSGYTPWQTVQR